MGKIWVRESRALGAGHVDMRVPRSVDEWRVIDVVSGGSASRVPCERLAARDRSQIVEERWVGNAGGVGAMNGGLAVSAQRGNGERHGDAMIAEGVQFGAVQALAAGNAQAVGTLVDLGSHLAQVGGNGGDAVRFLDAKFPRIAHLESIFGVGSDGGEDGNFVDE